MRFSGDLGVLGGPGSMFAAARRNGSARLCASSPYRDAPSHQVLLDARRPVVAHPAASVICFQCSECLSEHVSGLDGAEYDAEQ